jgi:hypothetical protein
MFMSISESEQGECIEFLGISRSPVDVGGGVKSLYAKKLGFAEDLVPHGITGIVGTVAKRHIRSG